MLRCCRFQRNIMLYFFPIVMALAWMVFLASAIMGIVYEKEKRLEEVQLHIDY